MAESKKCSKCGKNIQLAARSCVFCGQLQTSEPMKFTAFMEAVKVNDFIAQARAVAPTEDGAEAVGGSAAQATAQAASPSPAPVVVTESAPPAPVHEPAPARPQLEVVPDAPAPAPAIELPSAIASAPATPAAPVSAAPPVEAVELKQVAATAPAKEVAPVATPVKAEQAALAKVEPTPAKLAAPSTPTAPTKRSPPTGDLDLVQPASSRPALPAAARGALVVGGAGLCVLFLAQLGSVSAFTFACLVVGLLLVAGGLFTRSK